MFAKVSVRYHEILRRLKRRQHLVEIGFGEIWMRVVPAAFVIAIGKEAGKAFGVDEVFPRRGAVAEPLARERETQRSPCSALCERGREAAAASPRTPGHDGACAGQPKTRGQTRNTIDRPPTRRKQVGHAQNAVSAATGSRCAIDVALPVVEHAR